VAALLSARLLNGGKAKSFQILRSYLIQSQWRHTLTDAGWEYYEVMRWKGIWLKKDTSPLPNWLRVDIYPQVNSSSNRTSPPSPTSCNPPPAIPSNCCFLATSWSFRRLEFPDYLPSIGQSRACVYTDHWPHRATTHVSYVKATTAWERHNMHSLCACVCETEAERRFMTMYVLSMYITPKPQQLLSTYMDGSSNSKLSYLKYKDIT
jgi:hypothetical protein